MYSFTIIIVYLCCTQKIKERLLIQEDAYISVQYYDKGWDSFVDIEDVSVLENRMKLRVNELTVAFSVPNISNAATCENIVTIATQVKKNSELDNAALSLSSHWPINYTLPRHRFPESLVQALDQKVDLKKPCYRYQRGQLLQAITSQCLTLTSYPDLSQKLDMAKAIVREYPHLTENYGSGYAAWYASVCDSLKNSRRYSKRNNNFTSEVKKCNVSAATSAVPGVIARHSVDTVLSENRPAPQSNEWTISNPTESETSRDIILNEGQNLLHDLDRHDHTRAVEVVGSYLVPEKLSTNVADEVSGNNPQGSQCQIKKCEAMVYERKRPLVFRRSSSSIASKRGREIGSSELLDTSTNDSVITEMQEIMTLAEAERHADKLSHLMKQSYLARQLLIRDRVPIDQLRKMYPGLFTIAGIVNEYEQLNQVSNVLINFNKHLLELGGKLLLMTEESLQSRSKMSSVLQPIMEDYVEAVRTEDSLDVRNKHLLVFAVRSLPCLLKEDTNLICKNVQVYYVGNARFVVFINFVVCNINISFYNDYSLIQH